MFVSYHWNSDDGLRRNNCRAITSTNDVPVFSDAYVRHQTSMCQVTTMWKFQNHQTTVRDITDEKVFARFQFKESSEGSLTLLQATGLVHTA